MDKNHNDLEQANWMLEQGYILDVELFRVAAAIRATRERKEAKEREDKDIIL